MLIGILALQGDFPEHRRSVEQSGHRAREVRTKEDLKDLHGLILPGGESTVISRLLLSTGLDQAIRNKIRKGFPVWGTCAGAILLAKKIHAAGSIPGFLGVLPVEIERNSYGRQTDSFSAKISMLGHEVPVFFIRAPRIVKVGKGVRILARHGKDRVVIRYRNLLASTCHSELSHPNRILEYFLGMLKA